jgi:hypothetical protein
VCVGGASVELAATNWKPESNPPGAGEQGSAKLDWVTVWFYKFQCQLSYPELSHRYLLTLGWKWKTTWSPTSAKMASGVKAKPSFPTSTSCTAAMAPRAKVETIEAAVKNIASDGIWIVKVDKGVVVLKELA